MDQLNSGVDCGGNTWLCDMLRYWRPSGDQFDMHLGKQRALQAHCQGLEENPKHLHLAIRNGYMNFYRGGQSVAKVGLDRQGKLQAKIHNKYVYGDEGKGNGYITLTSAGFPELGDVRPTCYDSVAGLDKMI
jgi:hypothetical protein